VAAALIEMECYDINGGDYWGFTPLTWAAARNGHGVVVKILLSQEEVNPDMSDKYNQTPLPHAAWNGYEGVVKIVIIHRCSPEIHSTTLSIRTCEKNNGELTGVTDSVTRAK